MRERALMRGRAGKVVGVAVIEDYEVAWSEVHGGAPDRLFQAGSISKPVTALAALELAERGDLDADVNARLTGWQLPGPPGVSARQQLLGHTAGLGVPYYPGYPQGAELPTLRQSLDGMPPASTKPVRVDPAARGRFRYSGGGYTVIQQLITEVTGLWATPADLARLTAAVAAAAGCSSGGRPSGGRPSAIRPEVADGLLAARTPVPFRGEWMVLPLLGMRRPTSFGLGMFGFGGGRFGHIGGTAGFFTVLAASRATTAGP